MQDRVLQKEEESELPAHSPPEFGLKSEDPVSAGSNGGNGGAGAGNSGPGQPNGGGAAKPGGSAKPGANGAGAPAGNAAGGNGGGNARNGAAGPKPDPQIQAKMDQAKAKAPTPYQTKAGPGKGGEAGNQKKVFKGPKVKSNTTGLPDQIKTQLESVLGMDFSGVKVKKNSKVAIKNQAQALVKGNEVHFAPGKFNPNSQQGKKLIGHEFAHIKQQSEGRVKPTGKLNGAPINDSPSLEKEADALGQKASSLTEPGSPLEKLKTPAKHSEVLQLSVDPYARYQEMLTWAAEQKTAMTENITAQKEELTTSADTEKEALNTAVQTAIETMQASIDATIELISTTRDDTITAIEEHRTAKIDEVNQAADDEILKIGEMIQGKRDTITESGETRAERITTYGETEGTRASTESSANADELYGLIDTAAANYQNKDGIDDAVEAARVDVPTTQSEFITLGEDIDTAVNDEAGAMATDIRSDAEAICLEFDSPETDAIAGVNDKRDETIVLLEDAGTEFITNLETETTEVITELETQKTEQALNLEDFPLGAAEAIDEAVEEAHTALDQANEDVLAEIDDFLDQISEIGWYAEEVAIAEEELLAAIEEHETEVSSYVEEANTAITQASSELQPELDDFVSQVETILTDMETGYTTELETKQTEISDEMDTTATDAVDEIGTVSDNMEPDLDQAITDAEADWDQQVEDKETEITEKVDTALEDEEAVLTDFSSELESSFSQLPNKNRNIFEMAWDGVTGAFEFIAGIFVGMLEGLWSMIQGIGSIFSSWTNFLIAAVVIVIAVIAIAIVAALFGITFGLAALIVGIVIGLAMAGYYIYLAVTSEGLSPYDRGRLVGRGLFEGIMAFAGTGVLARLTRWAGRIGEIGSIVSKVGGLTRFLPILLKVDDVGRIINLIDKLEDAGRLGQLVDRASDVNALINLLENAGDAARIMEILDTAGDINALLTHVDDAAQLISLVDRAGDVGQLETLLNSVDDIALLDDLLNQVDDGEQLGRLLDFFGDGTSLDDFLKSGTVSDAASLDDLISLHGFRDADQLTSMLDDAGSMDNLTSILDNTGSAAAAEQYLTDLALVKDRLAAAGLRIVDEGGGNLRYFDDMGREVAVLENGTMRYTFGGFGGDIIAEPGVTTTIIGKFNDVMHPDWGTQYVLGLNEGMFSRMGSNPGGINVLDLPASEYDDLIARYGTEAGNQRFWELYNEPFLTEAFENGHTVRLLSDPNNPATRTGYYARELQTIEGFFDEAGTWIPGLAERYGYVFDSATNSWIPGHRAGTP